MVNSPKSRKRKPKYGLVEVGSEEELDRHKVQPRLSELFVDDAWGTAKSLPSLKQHSDHKKWLQRSGLSVKAFKDLEKRLSVYEELRDLDPNGFKALIEPIQSTDSAVCSPVELAKEYLCNIFLTAMLCLSLLSLSTDLQAVRYVTAGLLLSNMTLWLNGTSLYGKWRGLWWQETKRGHKAPWQTCFACNLAEVVYLVCTLGLGSLVSLGLRFGASRQSFSERALGVQLVKEFQTLTEDP